jgi:hypothetical protein
MIRYDIDIICGGHAKFGIPQHQVRPEDGMVIEVRRGPDQEIARAEWGG